MHVLLSVMHVAALTHIFYISSLLINVEKHGSLVVSALASGARGAKFDPRLR